MGTEKPAEYYDSSLKNFLIPYEDSIWKEVYDAVVSLMPTDTAVRIADIGCGTGRLAEALRQAGYVNYTGFDFSQKRVEEARRYLPSHDFRVLDAFSAEAFRTIQSADVVSITEVLEHIDRDIALLYRVPASRYVIGSVPNFDSAAHVRFFEDIEAVKKRFGAVLEMSKAKFRTIERGNKKTYVFGAYRRSGPVEALRHRLGRLGSFASQRW